MFSVEQTRLTIARSTDAQKKARLGQFFTPARTAAFMAGLFPDAEGDCRLLDAGAGIGSLSVAFLDRWRAGGLRFRRVTLDAFEIDASLHPYLHQALEQAGGGAELTATISASDFIAAAVSALAGDLFSEPRPSYTHAILNPPYKKINSDSAHRRALRSVGIETVNLYTAFVALAVALMAPGGQLVAIVPRSFCNGPYYRPFRAYILQRAAIRHLHLFDSRGQAFRDDAVLQENVIIRLERGGQAGPVTISTSTDDTFADLAAQQHAPASIVSPDDPELFIHIPTSPEQSQIASAASIRSTLAEIGIQVSTGPVIDFRLREQLRAMPEPGTVPLLYPAHFSGSATTWPIAELKKPNAIVHNPATARWLYPNGHYCVVRRFSAKEERRRIVASVVDPQAFGGAPLLGFENHLNVFHERRQGLPAELAWGLATFLNTTAVDQSFRRFNGHTQVNATDLRLMRYPSRSALIDLGRWAAQQAGSLDQAAIDARCEALIR